MSRAGEQDEPEGCEFCSIVNRQTPAEVIYETEDVLAFFPLEPATRGHTLVIPKRHIESFLDAEPTDVGGIGHAVLTVGKALRVVLSPEGMNLISSAGEAASQSVLHLHVHLVPRWKGDPIGEIWPPKVATSEQVLEEVAEAVRQFCRTEYLEERNPKDHQSDDDDHAV